MTNIEDKLRIREFSFFFNRGWGVMRFYMNCYRGCYAILYAFAHELLYTPGCNALFLVHCNIVTKIKHEVKRCDALLHSL